MKPLHVQTLRLVCSVFQSQSICCRIDPCPVHVLNSVGQALRRHGFLFDSLKGPHHLLPLRCQFSQYCSGAWANRQLTVEDAIRRKICPTRIQLHMDETLTIVLLEQRKKEGVTKLTTRPQIAESTQGKVGHHNVTRRDKEGSLRSRPQCPTVSSVNTLPRAHVGRLLKHFRYKFGTNQTVFTTPKEHDICQFKFVHFGC